MAGPNAPCSASASQEKKAAVARPGRAVAARVKKSGYFRKRGSVNALSTTPCLSGQTPVAIDDQPGPESVRDAITRPASPGSGLLGTTSPGDSVRGVPASPYGSLLVPYAPEDIRPARTGAPSATSRS
ncbi:hypothetical protein GCM10020001_016120 [Nonomuraea salmonea]